MKYIVFNVGIAIGLFVALHMLGCSSPAQEAKNKSRMAIKMCWKDYERKSLTEAEKRFIASTCEMMEQKFADTDRVKP